MITALCHRGEDVLGPLGVPLLHPWANRLSAPHYAVAGRLGRVPDAGFVERDDHGLAIHGLTRPPGAWRVEAAGSEALHAELDHPADAERHRAFPFPHRLEIDAVVSTASLTIATTLVPTAGVPVPVCFGYHPYLRLPGVRRGAWHVELPRMTHVELDLDRIPTGRSSPRPAWSGQLGPLAFDDAFVDVREGAEFVLQGGGRRITVGFGAGYPVAQVFAPRHEDIICFEPMTAPVNALVSGDRLPVVAPGERYHAVFTITVEDL
jgi:galactose mutarotase-like enzyme